MISDARFSPCKRYRYTLSRRWDLLLNGDKELVTFLMLNPSTADERKDDPTIRRCIGFAKGWGFQSLRVVNLFAWRATDPAELAKVEDPVGSENDAAILQAALDAQLMVCAWGAHKMAADRGRHVLEFVSQHSGACKPFCLGMTQAGEPWHPLYKAADLMPIEYQTCGRDTPHVRGSSRPKAV